MKLPFPDNTDAWMLELAPHTAVVVSSRARLARNLPQAPFAPRANAEQLQAVAQRVGEALEKVDRYGRWLRYDLSAMPPEQRCLLRESHLISSELEKGGVGRWVYLAPTMDLSIMVNEEDHVRMTALASGLRLEEVYRRIGELEAEVEKHLDFAYDEDFGYLTACPTNTGTGLRLSVMLHLPALVLTNQHEQILAQLGNFGLVVRGAYGEHSTHQGDLYQISNEITLGKTELQLMELLVKVVGKIIEQELLARENLMRHRLQIEDSVYRAVGLLGTARSMASSEAVQLLSRVRLGVGQEWGVPLRHVELSRLFVRIQPAHLQCLYDAGPHPEARDRARAALLREVFAPSIHPNN